MRYFPILLTITFCLLLTACGEDTLPKPKSQLSLAYGQPQHRLIDGDCPYTFEQNTIGQLRYRDDCSAVIDYPKLNGSLFLTYRKVDGNIKTLLNDAQKLTYEHTRKADDIDEKIFINHPHRVFGMFYDIEGNAASQSQFYITDSTDHFLTGSIYFNAKPNYDSIYPAAAYLKNDILHLMETVRWK